MEVDGGFDYTPGLDMLCRVFDLIAAYYADEASRRECMDWWGRGYRLAQEAGEGDVYKTLGAVILHMAEISLEFYQDTAFSTGAITQAWAEGTAEALLYFPYLIKDAKRLKGVTPSEADLVSVITFVASKDEKTVMCLVHVLMELMEPVAATGVKGDDVQIVQIATQEIFECQDDPARLVRTWGALAREGNPHIQVRALLLVAAHMLNLYGVPPYPPDGALAVDFAAWQLLAALERSPRVGAVIAELYVNVCPPEHSHELVAWFIGIR